MPYRGTNHRPAKSWLFVWCACVAMVATLALGCSSGKSAKVSDLETSAQASVGTTPDDYDAFEVCEQFRQDPMSFYENLRDADAVRCGNQLLQEDETLSSDEKKDILTTLATIHLAQENLPVARACFSEILSAGSSVELNREDQLIPPVKELFYAMRDSLRLSEMEQGKRISLDIKTVAVADLDFIKAVNDEGRYDLEKFAVGLTRRIMTDLSQVTSLKIVERQHLAQIKDEIQMTSNRQVFDPQYAARLGQLCGAQSFLFGQLIQTESNRIEFDLHWVDTSTGVILLGEAFGAHLSSAKDVFELEKKVLVDLLVPKVEQMLAGVVPERGGGAGSSGDTRDLAAKAEEHHKNKERQEIQGGDYLDYIQKVGEAILAESAKDYESARSLWQEVVSMNTSDRMAAQRAKALHAYVALADNSAAAQRTRR